MRRHPGGAVLRRRAGARPGRTRRRPAATASSWRKAMRRRRSTQRSHRRATSRAKSLSTLAQAGQRACRAIPTPTSCPAWRCPPARSGRGCPSPPAAAAGLALDGNRRRVFALLGDGECEEGQVWEAAMFAAPSPSGQPRWPSWTATACRSTAARSEVCDPGDLGAKFAAFGWDVRTGRRARPGGPRGRCLRPARPNGRDAPHALIAHTVKGKGVSFMEDQAGWHGKAPERRAAGRLRSPSWWTPARRRPDRG